MKRKLKRNDGHQFHQYYQQNETHHKSLNIKLTTAHCDGNPGFVLVYARKWGGVKPFNGIQSLPSLSIQRQNKYKQMIKKKPTLPFKKISKYLHSNVGKYPISLSNLYFT